MKKENLKQLDEKSLDFSGGKNNFPDPYDERDRFSDWTFLVPRSMHNGLVLKMEEMDDFLKRK